MSGAKRHWAIAGLAGAYAVIVPVALLIMLVAPTLSVDFGLAASPAGERGPGPMVEAWTTTFGLAFAAGTVVGVPLALAFTGVMALIEPALPGARLLLAWAGGGALAAGLPLVLITSLLLGVASVAVLTGMLLGCVGASVAWFVRHGRMWRPT